MAYSTVAILALMAHFLINSDVLFRSADGESGPVYRTYRFFLLSVMLFYAADGCWGVLYERGWILPTYADTVIYFVAMALSLLLWSRYVVTYLNLSGGKRRAVACAGWVYFALLLIALGVNFFRPVLFGFTPAGVYYAGPVRHVALLMQAAMFLICSVSALITALRSKGLVRLRTLAIGLYGLVMATAILLQIAYPFQPFYAAGCMIGACVIHTYVIGVEREEKRRELERLLVVANTDALTGLGSPHAYVDAQLDLDRRLTEGSLTAFAVVAFDLDRLKEINDTLGHEAGDRALCAAAEMIARRFSGSPAFRVGGDEFAVVLEGENYDRRAALLAAFNEEATANITAGRVAVAAGMAEFDPAADVACHPVFVRADEAMYRRKAALHEQEDARV